MGPKPIELIFFTADILTCQAEVLLIQSLIAGLYWSNGWNGAISKIISSTRASLL